MGKKKQNSIDKGDIMLNDKRIRIIIGHYGSGKTEFSVNYAINLAKSGKKVAIADLDVVNPYFRSREKFEFLRNYGILAESSYMEGSSVDVPSVSAGILGPLQNEDYDLIVDVGGDFAGARALGRYRKYLVPDQYDMFCVVNANRPETQTVAGVMYHIEAIEETSRAEVTGLINNTHLLKHTTVEDVLRGIDLCEKVSDALDIPIKYISVIESVAKELPNDLEGQVIPIKMIMRENWM